ncbi:MAG: AraC family transcriptional regulator [Bacteroidaceae bacterium]|nr:AraC family transcriptional regulator [Bacteroidaceae bacterium]
MSERTLFLILFAANLTFIVTNLYGWVLKWFYRPKAYREHFHELFPAQRAVGMIYLMQIFEIPYLVQIGNPDALLYVNSFSVLIFSLQMLVMCEKYFFPRAVHRKREYSIFIPGVLIMLPLFLHAVHLIDLPDGYRPWVFGVVSVVFLFYFALNLNMALRIGRMVKMVNEAAYSDSDDFPVRFALYIQWVPTLVCVMLFTNFLFDNVWAKFVRDLIFIFTNVWFCIFTLNPWRKAFTKREEEMIEQIEQPDNTTCHLNDKRSKELCNKLEDMLMKEHIFTEPHITIDILIQRLGTNSKYITEIIRRSGYQSFYDMICQHRVRHAISLIHQNPDERLHVIADQCGFSSPSSMAKAFQSQGKPAPSSFKTQQ